MVACLFFARGGLKNLTVVFLKSVIPMNPRGKNGLYGREMEGKLHKGYRWRAFRVGGVEC